MIKLVNFYLATYSISIVGKKKSKQYSTETEKKEKKRDSYDASYHPSHTYKYSI